MLYLNMAKKLSYQYVYNTFKKESYKLLSKIYQNNRQKLIIICPKGHKHQIAFDNFRQGQRCARCAGLIKYTIDDVRKIFEKEGYDLLSKNYNDNKGKILFRCPKGHIHVIKLNSFLQGQRCGICFGTKRHSLKEVKNKFKEKGWKLISKYINTNHPLKVKCDKGHIITTLTFHNFIKGIGCKYCWNNYNRGKNNARWNINLSDEERLQERDIQENTYWIKKVLKRDKHNCQCCGEKGNGHNLNVHHLEGYHWCKELRFEVSNGITLCKTCHKSFHKDFSNAWNTSEQFYQFLRTNNA